MQSDFWPRAGVLLAAAVLAGCPASQTAGIPGKPFAGARISIASPPEFAPVLTRLAPGWSNRTGGTIVIVKPGETADVAVVPAADVGAWADRAAPLPASFQAEDQAAKWTRILPAYRDRLTGWGSTNLAVPLAGDGYATVYRADLWADPVHAKAFRAKFNRELLPPTTWEDIAEAAEYFAAATGQPSLPALPTGPALLREFHFLAACYDRPALAESSLTRQDRTVDLAALPRILSFHHALPKGEPRLNSPGFVAAAGWLHRTAKLRPATGDADPAAALSTGTAVVATCSLAELAKLAGRADEVPAKFGLAALPGTRTTHDPITQQPVPSVNGVNFVPYYGAGGYAAVVLKTVEKRDAALDFLGELAGPIRSLDVLATPSAGFGPFRTEHLEQTRDTIYLSLRFDPARTKILADGIRKYSSPATVNPCYAVRGPDTAELQNLLEASVRKAARGELDPATAMSAAQKAWLENDGRHPDAAATRRKAAGLGS
jgi:multiple sugar transport system substrate-binding protein